MDNECHEAGNVDHYAYSPASSFSAEEAACERRAIYGAICASDDVRVISITRES